MGSRARNYTPTPQILIITGSETSATLLTIALYYLLRSPDKLRKLREEVRGAFNTRNELTFSDIQRLPYLRAIL